MKEKKSKIEVVKTIVKIIVPVGVGAVISNAIKATSDDDKGIVQNIMVMVGSLVLTSMISDAATKYAETKFDEAVDGVKKMVKEAETN
jgi:predicted Na+-dependent transporter